jgi:prepilin-type N-terminal cleavage/methylation domain-containing protein
MAQKRFLPSPDIRQVEMVTRLSRFNQRASGFTIIEVIISIAIVGIISVAVASTIGMLYRVNASSLNRANAIRQVQNAGMWVTQDIQSAQTITIGGTHVLEALWTDWDGTKYKVDYDYGSVVTTDLARKYYVKLTTDAGFSATPTSQIIVAHFIDHANTNFIQSGSVYNLTITAKITGLSANGQAVSETRTYEILPRPGS